MKEAFAALRIPPMRKLTSTNQLMKTITPFQPFFLTSLCLTFLLLFSFSAYSEPDFNEPDEKSFPAGVLAGRSQASDDTVFLPLRRSNIHLHLTGGILTTQIEQEFTNTSDLPLEAVYVFPLPSEASVTNMEIRVGRRIIRSVVKEKEAAKNIYQEAKASGRKTALIEQERPNIFTTSIANFLPGETVTIRLTTLQSAEYRKGSYSITFPLVVGPRFIPIDMQGDNTDRITPPLAHPSFDTHHRARIKVTVEGIPVSEITSNTHSIKVIKPNKAGKPYQVTLRKKLILPNSDFNLKISLRKSETPSLKVIQSEKNDFDYSLITLFPPTKNTEPKEGASMARDVLFLIDTSGSMDGASIGQAKAGLQACLKRLRPQDQFTVVRFSSEFSSFAPDLRAANAKNLAAGRSYIDSLQSGGGTNMQPALIHTLDIPGRKNSMRLIVFLTDGAVGNEHSLLQLLDHQLGDARLFTFGIGSAPNEFLMKKMAQKGRGQSRFIRSHEDVGEVIADFFQTLDNPVLTDLTLSLRDRDGQPLDNVSYYPNPLPDVFSERPVQVIAKYPKGTLQSLQIAGKNFNKQLSYSYNLKNGDIVQSQSIGKLHGRAQIDELMLARMQAENENELYDLKRQVVETALEHQLITQFTSRVAFEELAPRTLLGKTQTVKVPSLLPQGWSADAFFPTATYDPLLLLAAGLSALLTVLLLTARKSPKGKEEA